MSSAQVAKLEALLARVHSRRLEPGLRLVDAPASAHVVSSDADVGLDEPATIPPPASTSSLLTLDEPILTAAAPAPVESAAPAVGTRTTLDVDPELDDLIEVDVPQAAAVAAPLPAKLEPIEPSEDALITAVARPAPIMQLDEPVAPVAVAPVVPEPVAAPPVVAQATGPVIMQAPLPVASGPIASFVGTPQRHALSFGELVGLAMSLTTR
ncbi:MAG: hypothetical protein IPI43_33205 [Sandaracinaceae bacterium]|nr:hypothetical protein [Sandaracinaceae bacterium]MBK8587748.1 hypothetical protein [Sandaracinaceae bacterium]